MDVVIIGPSDRSLLWREGTVTEAAYELFVEEYATLLAKCAENVIVTPDDGVYADIALVFGQKKGKKAIAYYPDKDTYYGIDHIKGNFEKYDIRGIDGDWYTLNAELTKQAPVVICVGFSPGALIELSFIKYHQKYGGYKDAKLKDIHLFVDRRCVKGELPLSFSEQIQNLQYFSDFDELERLIQETKKRVDLSFWEK